MIALLAPLLEREATHARARVPRDHPAVAIYEGTVRHRRFVPTFREFAPKLFLAYLDVDALPGSLDSLPLWSARRPAPVRFRPRDFLDGTDRPLGAAVRDLVQARLGRRPTGSVHLLAQLRTFGWLFNPLAVYYCWTPDGRALDAIVLEVTNTPWGQRHWYVLDAQTNMSTTTTAKAMHVSPFLPTDLDYRITWTVPDAELTLRIEVERDHTPIFDAELALHRTTINRGRALRLLARYPMLTLRVSAGIYARAARLFARSSRAPESLTTAGKDRPMNSTTNTPARLARAVVMRLLKRTTGGTVRLVDPFGDARFGDDTAPQASPPLDVTVRVRDTRAYSRILQDGSVGLGESYADGWWDTHDLTGFLRLAHRSLARTHTARDRIHRWLRPVVDPVARRRRADKDRDARNVRAHYDLGNAFFQRILDETMMYSCAVFERPTDSLAEASVHKLDRLANLLALAPGDRVLEIGTGWGGFAVHAATHYGCHVTTTTISQRQYEFAQRRVKNAGLEDRVTVLADDYRDLEGTFDKIIAIEMIEAVDWRDYDTFFAHCRRLLDDAGALAMQAIVVRDESFDRIKLHTDFIKTAIFPGGCLPSVRALTAAANSNGFSHAHEDDIGLHYGETLRRWRRNLTDARGDLDALGLDERFVRLWEFYFSYCEAAFEERYVRDVQLLYTAPAWRPPALRTAAIAEAIHHGCGPALVRT